MTSKLANLQKVVKENERLREALNKIGFYCAGESMISQVALEAITNLTLTAQNLDPMPPLPSTSAANISEACDSPIVMCKHGISLGNRCRNCAGEIANADKEKDTE